MSVYKRQMGEEYQKLHPQLQKRFDFSISNNIAFIGKGEMEEVWNGNKIAVFILKILSKSNILFPRIGKNIPFEIHNYPYLDDYNRETHTMSKLLFFGNEEQRFDGTALFSEKKNHIVEYLGLDHKMSFDMALSVEKGGSIKFKSKRQFIYLFGIQFPIPSFTRGNIELIQWFDDEQNKFYIDMSVKSRLFGSLFGFKGWFNGEYIDFKNKTIPDKFKPTKIQKKE